MEFNIWAPQAPPIFYLESIGASGIATGMVRVRDRYDRYYEFKLDDHSMQLLPSIDNALGTNDDPTQVSQNNYDIVINTNDYAGALIKVDPNTGNYPELGKSNVQVIQCSILSRGRAAAPVFGQMTHIMNGGGSIIPIVWDTRKVFIQSDNTVDYTDPQVQMNAATMTAHLGTDGNGAVSMGAGTNGHTIDPKMGMSTSVNAMTHAHQETNYGGAMLTTSLNFLQHWLIGICNAVALPMPHMINLPKMISVGGFVKSMITATETLVKQIDHVGL